MAIGKKTGGNDFKPGKPGGPGRPPIPDDLKAAKRLTKTEFERILNRHLWSTDDELAASMKDPSLPAVEKLLVSILSAGVSQGDQGRAEWLIQRLLGKVSDRIELNERPSLVITRPDGTQVTLGMGDRPKELLDGDSS